MPWIAEYLPAKKVVAVMATGAISSEDAQAQVVKVITLLRQHRSTLVLADYSDGLSDLTMSGLYELLDCSTKLGAPSDARVAVVVSRKRYQIANYYYIGLICKNAGYNVNFFDHLQTAEDWLLQLPPTQLPVELHPEIRPPT